MIKLNDESLKTVVGGEGYFPRARTAAKVVALPGAGMGACAGIIIGSLNGFASSKIYAEQTRMGFIKKTVTIAAKTLLGSIGGGIGGALVGAASGAALGAGFGMSADIIAEN